MGSWMLVANDWFTVFNLVLWGMAGAGLGHAMYGSFLAKWLKERLGRMAQSGYSTEVRDAIAANNKELQELTTKLSTANDEDKRPLIMAASALRAKSRSLIPPCWYMDMLSWVMGCEFCQTFQGVVIIGVVCWLADSSLPALPFMLAWFMPRLTTVIQRVSSSHGGGCGKR